MILLALVCFLLSINPATAQDSSTLFEQYKNDYSYQRDLYQQSYLNYVNKKQIHTTYGTLITLNDKIGATKQALLARNNLLRTYLMALRTKLSLIPPMDTNTTQKLQIDLNRWEDWFNEQNTIVDSLNNDDDISQYVSEFKKQYNTVQAVIYTSLIVDEINLRYHTLNLIQVLSDQVETNPNLSPENQQWLSSVVVKSDLVVKNLNQAYDLTQSTLQRSKQFNNFYPTAKQELNQANNYLLGMVNGLRSIITKLDTPPNANRNTSN